MQNTKKMLALLLVVAMLTLTACSGGGGSSDVSGPAGDDVSSSTTTGSNAADVSTDGTTTTGTGTGADATGTTGNAASGSTTAGGNQSGSTSVTISKGTGRTQSGGNVSGGSGTDAYRGQKLVIMSRDNFTGSADIQKAYTSGLKSWMTRYGSSYEFFVCDYGYADLQSAIAAGKAPDLFYQVERFPEVCAVGLVQPIEDYLPDGQKVLDAQSISYGSWRGHVWGMGIGNGGGRTYIRYDSELFAANPSIKTPRQYFEEGNWTWDTFRQVAKDIVSATNSQYGVKFNQIPTFGGHDIVSVSNDGKVTSTLATDEYNNALLQWIYRLKMTDKVFDLPNVAIAVYQGDAEPKYGTNGKTKVLLENRYWDIVPYPSRPGTTEHISHTQIFSFVVPVGAQNPAMSTDLALAMLQPWKSTVDNYKYTDYEAKVRKTAANATPILKYPDVLTYLPYNDSDATYGALYNTATGTALAQLGPVHAADANTYNSTYIK